MNSTIQTSHSMIFDSANSNLISSRNSVVIKNNQTSNEERKEFGGIRVLYSINTFKDAAGVLISGKLLQSFEITKMPAAAYSTFKRVVPGTVLTTSTYCNSR